MPKETRWSLTPNYHIFSKSKINSIQIIQYHTLTSHNIFILSNKKKKNNNTHTHKSHPFKISLNNNIFQHNSFLFLIIIFFFQQEDLSLKHIPISSVRLYHMFQSQPFKNKTLTYHDSDFSVPTGNKNCGIAISTKKEKKKKTMKASEKAAQVASYLVITPLSSCK